MRCPPLLGAGLAAAAVLACDGSPTGPRVPPLCTAIASVTISPGLTPVFAWSPECGANFLDVIVPGPPVEVMWSLQSISGEVLSPVTYGQEQRHTRVTTGPRPLEAGGAYELLIGYFSGPLAIPLQRVPFQR